MRTRSQTAPWHPFSQWILVGSSSAIWAVRMQPAVRLLCAQPGTGWMGGACLPAVCCPVPPRCWKRGWFFPPLSPPPHGCPWFLVDSLIFIPRYDPGYQVTPSRPLCLLPEQAVCDLLHNHASLLELLHNREGHAVLTEGPGEHSALPGEHTSREIQPHGYAAYSLTSQGLAHSRCPVYASVE